MLSYLLVFYTLYVGMSTGNLSSNNSERDTVTLLVCHRDMGNTTSRTSDKRESSCGCMKIEYLHIAQGIVIQAR
jgi:hypothetical protein